jgi:hypothetical protein
VGTLPAGLASVPIAQRLTGLSPATTYYVALVASSSAGAVASSPTTFTTAPIAAPTRRAATIVLAPGSVRLSRSRKALVAVRCPKAEPYSCQGVLAIRSVKALPVGRASRARVVFGSLRFDIRAGTTARVGPLVPKTKAALVRRLGKVQVTVSVITQGASLTDQRYFARRVTLLPSP